MSWLTTETDLKTLPDLSFETQSDTEVLIEDMLWILLTPRGALFYDLEYGYGIGNNLNDNITDELLNEMAIRAVNALERDPRIQIATCVVRQPKANTLDVEATATTRDGQVTLIAQLNTLTTEVLYANAR